MMKTEAKKETIMIDISLEEMLKKGVHFGHQKAKWYPKMKPYLFTTRRGVHIIDLEKTAEKIQEAFEFITKTVKADGQILFVATKRQAQEIVKKYAKEADSPYLAERWIGGLLTNYSVVSSLVKKLKKLRREKETGELDKYTKKEQLKFHKEIEQLEKIVGGIENLKGLPQALFIIDIGQEKTALKEARKKKIPIIAMVDTNNNPNLVDYPIPANDDATKSIDYITSKIAQCIKEGSAKKGEDKPKEEKPKEDKPKEDKPKEDKPKEDKPKEDKPKEDKPKEDKPKEDKPKEDKPKEDKLKKDTESGPGEKK